MTASVGDVRCSFGIGRAARVPGTDAWVTDDRACDGRVFGGFAVGSFGFSGGDSGRCWMKGAGIGRGSDGPPEDGRRGPGVTGVGCGRAGYSGPACRLPVFDGFLPEGTGRSLAMAGLLSSGLTAPAMYRRRKAQRRVAPVDTSRPVRLRSRRITSSPPMPGITASNRIVRSRASRRVAPITNR